MILPHEHVFVDLRTWDQPGYAEAAPEDVVTLMAPEVERAAAVGVTAIVECTPEGVGRRAEPGAVVSCETSCPSSKTPTIALSGSSGSMRRTTRLS